MRHSLLHFALVLSFFLTNFSTFWSSLFPNEKNHQEIVQVDDFSMTMCSPAAQIADSMVLVKFYNALSGPGWPLVNQWNMLFPVCTWPGIDLDSEGYVIRIELQMSNLVGSIPPEIGDLSRLALLKLSGNQGLSGPIPPELGNATALTTLWLDGKPGEPNGLSGTLPTTLENLINLEVIFLDNTNLGGPIPQGWVNLTNLLQLEFHDSNFDSLPDFSNTLTQTNDIKAANNRLTFDDILPNIPVPMGGSSTYYAPQQQIYQEETITLFTGSSHTIDLGIDAGIATNEYQWFKDGSLYGTILYVNKLTFDPVVPGDAGVYHVEVQNPGAPGLTLVSYEITVIVECGASINDYEPVLCDCESVIVNGNVYDCNNPTGTETISGGDQWGCDSIINVNITYTSPVTTNFEPMLCDCESVVVNGTIYDCNNTSGTEEFPCDSTVNVALSYYPEASTDIDETICQGDTIYINNVAYFAPITTTEVLDDVSVNGCDSTLNINIDLFPLATDTLDQMICTGSSIIVNGTTYDESNPTGDEVFENASSTGCDSLVHIDLMFGGSVSANLDTTLCEDEFITVNGNNYGGAFPNSGSETFIGGSFQGCDSIVIIDVTNVSSSGFVAPFLCDCESLVINGTTYDCNNPNGTEVLSGADQYGCDSTVQIFLNYYPPVPPKDTIFWICSGESVNFNGTTYDINNDEGTEIIDGVAANGCDSTYNVIINVYDEAAGNYNPTICQGGSIEFNGTIYDETNDEGIEILEGQSYTGCDSIVNVQINIGQSTAGEYSETLCEGESTIYNGHDYGGIYPDTGMEILEGTGAGGCDSMVNVTITYFPDYGEGSFTPTICAGTTIDINGNTYGGNGPLSGTEILNGDSFHGCDSIVQVAVSFFNIETGTFTQTICKEDNFLFNGVLFGNGGDVDGGITTLLGASTMGCDSNVNVVINYIPVADGIYTPTICKEETIIFNGTDYHFGNPTGTEILTDANYLGCDSVVNVQLAFYTEPVFDLNQTLCEGTSIFVNGVEYGESPLPSSGTELIPNASWLGCDSTVIIMLDFNSFVVNNISETFCGCQPLEINGTTYDCNNTMGSDTIFGGSFVGCDSIINVNLTYHDATTSDFNPTLCPEESIVVNGTTYGGNGNPITGTEIFPGANSNGCDSIVTISINTYENLNTEVSHFGCTGDEYEVTVNGTIYNEANPMGTEIITSVNGCDSTITIDLEFSDILSGLESYEGCIDDGYAVTVNGMVYDQQTPFGQEILTSSGGCDSIVTIILVFNNEINETISHNGCFGDGYAVVVNGNTYDELNPSGSETMMSVAGCDSIVTIDLVFNNEINETISHNGCNGDGFSVTVNGNTYNELNPAGSENMTSAAGCDSIVTIDLVFNTEINETISHNGCNGDGFSVTVNGNTYNELNPTGSENMASAAGCDSIVTINLVFSNEINETISHNGCNGDGFSVTVNGNTYNELNPTGSETMMSVAGCDSIVTINLVFNNEINETISHNGCIGDGYAVVVNGNTYNELNPTGSETMMSVAGCDSIVTVNLIFSNEINETISHNGCNGDGFSVTVNGNTYNELNPEGSETMTSVAGCDSIVTINLNFSNVVVGEELYSGCSGDGYAVIVNGSTYNETMAFGQETLTSANGCDSIVTIQLTFSSSATNAINAQICNGNSYTINNATYDVAGLYTETISGGAASGCDSIVTLTLEVEDPFTFGMADAGQDQSQCNDETNLDANLPSGTTGNWMTNSPAIISLENNSSTLVSALVPGENIFIWMLSTEVCPQYDSDTVMVFIEDNYPIANDDEVEIQEGETTISIDILDNDDLSGAQQGILELTSLPEVGTLTPVAGNLYEYTLPEVYQGELLAFTYQICNGVCPDLCDEATVIIRAEVDEDIQIPSGITPNGDGLNETFVIPDIEYNPEKYTKAELLIYNRWGDVVFQAQPYNNDWAGTAKNGKSLPQGTYYYLLKVDLDEGKVYQGDITILK